MRTQIQWDSEDVKQSHPGKTLKQHHEEVLHMYKKLVRCYGYHQHPLFIKNPKLDEVVSFVARYHDMGKLHPDWKLGGVKPGFSHASMSILWLIQHGLLRPDKDVWEYTKTYLILKHHGLLMDVNANQLKTFLSNREIRRWRSRWKDSFERYFSNGRVHEGVILADLYGLFKVADMLSAESSNISLKDIRIGFSYTLDELKRRIKEYVSRRGLDFDEDRFNIQSRLAGASDFTVLRAYTGWGKTTSSILYAADRYVNRVFIILPTTTSINRFHDTLLQLFTQDEVSKYFYFYIVDEFLGIDPDSDDLVWLDRLSKSFLNRYFLRTPINITTIDQFLLTFLMVGKYHLKRFNFYRSVLILDEVHLYTPKMLAYTLFILKNYRCIYGLRTLFMSATLPDELVNLLREYAFNELGLEPDIFDYLDAYKNRLRIRYTLHLDRTIMDDVSRVKESLDNGRRVLVLVNRPDTAIKLYLQLRDMGVPEDSLIILHSRYMYPHRKDKEKKIEDYSSKPHIFIATQVAEVSLDISYDELYTELAPLPSLIQRFGRVNRYGKRVEEANVHIYRPYGDSERWYLPYGKMEMTDTESILPSYEGVNLSNEYQLIQKYNEVFDARDYYEELKNDKIRYILEVTSGIYSIDTDEERVKEIIGYRDDRMNILALPDPDMIMDNQLRNRLQTLLEQWEERDKSLGIFHPSIRRLFIEIKTHLTPIPIYLLRRYSPDNIRRAGFPIIHLTDYIYDPILGLAPSEVIENVI